MVNHGGTMVDHGWPWFSQPWFKEWFSPWLKLSFKHCHDPWLTMLLWLMFRLGNGLICVVISHKSIEVGEGSWDWRFQNNSKRIDFTQIDWGGGGELKLKWSQNSSKWTDFTQTDWGGEGSWSWNGPKIAQNGLISHKPIGVGEGSWGWNGPKIAQNGLILQTNKKRMGGASVQMLASPPPQC